MYDIFCLSLFGIIAFGWIFVQKCFKFSFYHGTGQIFILNVEFRTTNVLTRAIKFDPFHFIYGLELFHILKQGCHIGTSLGIFLFV